MVNAAYSAPSYPTQPATPAAPSVRDMAAAGHFRAIALWLNEPLAPQGIYVQVQADQPGCLKLLLEFERLPLKERLIRFLCHRVWLLNSPLIEGIYIIARPAGRRRVVWQQRIRVVTPALRERRQQQGLGPVAPTGSPLPPRLRVANTVPIRSATTARAKALVGTQLKTFRAFMLTGSAVAAFIFGCLMEVILAGGPTPTLPTFSSSRPEQHQLAELGESNEFVASDRAGQVPSTEVVPVRYEVPGHAYGGQPPQARPPIVDAAKEPVAVIQQPVVAQSPQDDVSLLFGGDISLEDISYDETGEAQQLFAGLPEYQQADLAMVNLDSSLAMAATTLKEELYHRSRPDAIEVLKQGGVDIVNLTNEDTMEFGGEGLAETLETLDRGGLYRVGAGRNELEARRPEVIDVKGKRIAYLSYAQGGDEAAHGDRPGINAQGMLSIAEDIRALRDEVDWIVVNYRWQTDIPEQPADWQTNLARLAVDQGADLVVGYHPQTLQGAEIYKGRPIVYSLGDFIFQKSSMDPDAPGEETAELPQDQDTAVLKVDLKDNQMKVEFVPVKVKDSQPEVATGHQSTEILGRIEKASAGFEKPMGPSVILELKGKAPTAAPSSPPAANPDAPFVSPQPEQTTPVEPLIDQDLTDQQQETQPDNGSAPAGSEAPDGAATLEESLEGWGPKGTPAETEFTPIPQTGPDYPSSPDGYEQPDPVQGDGLVAPSAQEDGYEQPTQFRGDGPISPTMFEGDGPSQPTYDDYSNSEGLLPQQAYPDHTESNASVGEKEHPSHDDPAQGSPTHDSQTINGPALSPELTPKPEPAKPFGEPLVGPLGAVEAPATVAELPSPARKAAPEAKTKPASQPPSGASLDTAAAPPPTAEQGSSGN